MAQEKNNENLQAELESLTAERDALKMKVGTLEKDVEELKNSKDYWYKAYEQEHTTSQKLRESLCGLRAVIDGIVNQ